jgi:ribosome biogenesis GTPase / thiamine phosphate phosphatase
MSGKPKKSPREKDLTARYLSGNLDEDRVESVQRFTHRSANAVQDKILRTALLRADEEVDAPDVNLLPLGQVMQVYSLYSEVESAGKMVLCVVRKTLTKVKDTQLVVGDRVRIRDTGEVDEADRRSAVIEAVLPRQTLLTRTDSFKGFEQHPIVSNAEQMLIVVALADPTVKWGLVDRMIVAAEGGKLRPIICLNKIDLADSTPTIQKQAVLAEEILAHYAKLNITTFKASVIRNIGLDELRDHLRGKTTVLAGHSGVGKSSLIRAIEPQLDIRVGAISNYTGKGRHTTTSARHYPLQIGGAVIDTPGVKMFGLWGVTRENVLDFFPDIADHTAPQWRIDGYERIVKSLHE